MIGLPGRAACAIYTALLTLLVYCVGMPLLPLLRLVSRRVRDGGRDLFGILSGEIRSFNSIEGPLLWLHGVSVGEVNAMRPLLAGLRERGFRKFLVTSTCPEGVARARELNDRGDLVAAYHPLDLPRFVRRLLADLNPAAIVILEVDLWPNLARAAAALGIPLFLANARVSRKTALFYGLLPSFARAMFGGVAGAFAQTAGDAARLAALGVPPERIEVTGNLKFDIHAPDEVRPETRERFRSSADGCEPPAGLCGGSTHPGEERLLLEAALLLAERGACRREDLLVILAPRNIRRVDEVLRLGADLGFHSVAWSDRPPRPVSFPRLLVIDRFGILPELYRLCRFAYIGGSGARGGVGGHNLIEAAAAGVPILFGPDMRNFRDSADELIAAGCAFPVRDASECAERIADLQRDPGRCRAISGRLVAFHEAHRGAAARILAALDRTLAPKRESA